MLKGVKSFSFFKIKRRSILIVIIFVGVFFLSVQTMAEVALNKINHYQSITNREQVSFGYDKIAFVLLSLIFVMLPYNKRSSSATDLSNIVLLVYAFMIALSAIDMAMTVRVFNSIYYFSFIFMCHITWKSIRAMTRDTSRTWGELKAKEVG